MGEARNASAKQEMMAPTEDQIKDAARAMITRRLAKEGIYPNEGTDVLEDVPAELLEDMMDMAEAALASVKA
jgi:hypothetical protein